MRILSRAGKRVCLGGGMDEWMDGWGGIGGVCVFARVRACECACTRVVMCVGWGVAVSKPLGCLGDRDPPVCSMPSTKFTLGADMGAYCVNGSTSGGWRFF